MLKFIFDLAAKHQFSKVQVALCCVASFVGISIHETSGLGFPAEVLPPEGRGFESRHRVLEQDNLRTRSESRPAKCYDYAQIDINVKNLMVRRRKIVTQSMVLWQSILPDKLWRSLP